MDAGSARAAAADEPGGGGCLPTSDDVAISKATTGLGALHLQGRQPQTGILDSQTTVLLCSALKAAEWIRIERSMQR